MFSQPVFCLSNNLTHLFYKISLNTNSLPPYCIMSRTRLRDETDLELLNRESGPEWEYCLRLAKQSRAENIQFDNLYVNVIRDSDEKFEVIEILQALCTEGGTGMSTSLIRFDFNRLRELIGPNSDNYDFVFEAYDKAGILSIPDARSYRRLLLAIDRLGFPIPEEVHQEAFRERPLVLRFFAFPKGSPPRPSPRRRRQFARQVEEPSPDRGRQPERREQEQSQSRHRQFVDRQPGLSPDRSRQSTPSPQEHRASPPADPSLDDDPFRRHSTPALPEVGNRGADNPISPQDTPGVSDNGAENTGNSFLPSSNQGTPADNPISPRGPPSVPDDGAEHEGDSSPQLSPEPMDIDVPPPHKDPEEQAEEELTLEQRQEHGLDYGFSNDTGIHDESIHNLYADIAGISRNRRDPSNESHKYKPPYSNISLPPHQSYPTAWLLKDSARIVHYLGDKPGLGKTFAACEALVRLTLIMSNKVAIDNEREQLLSLRDRPLHIHEKEHPRWGKNTECRANTLSKWGFTCFCAESSPLHEIMEVDGNFSTGYILVLVPINVCKQWFTQIKRFIRASTRLPHNQKPFEVINIHDDPDGPGDALKRFIFGEREHHGLGTIVVVPTTSTVKAALDELDEKEGEIPSQPSLIILDEVHRIRGTNHLSIKFTQALIDKATYPVHVLALSGSPMENAPSDFNVVESIALKEHAFAGWYGDDVYGDYRTRLQSARANLNEHAKLVTRSGIVGRGRKHKVPDEEKDWSRAIMKSYDSRCREYATEIPLLQRKELSYYLGFRIPRSQPEHEGAEIVRCDSTMNDLQKRVANNYKSYLRLRYQHRVRVWSRKPESTRGPRPKMAEVLFELDANQAPLPRSSVSHTSITETSLINFAPGLASQVLNRLAKSDQFRSNEANRIFCGTTTTTQRLAVQKSQFWTEAESAFQKLDETGQKVLHPKIEAICKIIDEMLADQTPHADGKKSLGTFRKKAVICVPHAWQGYILITYLFYRYPRHNFTFIGAGNSQQERDSLLAPFQRSTDFKHPEDARGDDPIALISTYNLMGLGLNLTRCNYAICTSPLSNMSQELQMFARINRQGQHAKTHTYVLLDNGNPVDVVTFHRMQKRTALTVPEDEMGWSGLDFLMQDIAEAEDEEVDPAFESGAEDSEPERE